ncbi:MAG: hypothetical protein Q8L21_00305 [Candidatus Komeilibacteria bacterium]|nr:hypothetical protein [Candidatus Komeilibacteria bacterium]
MKTSSMGRMNLWIVVLSAVAVLIAVGVIMYKQPNPVSVSDNKASENTPPPPVVNNQRAFKIIKSLAEDNSQFEAEESATGKTAVLFIPSDAYIVYLDDLKKIEPGVFIATTIRREAVNGLAVLEAVVSEEPLTADQASAALVAAKQENIKIPE